MSQRMAEFAGDVESAGLKQSALRAETRAACFPASPANSAILWARGSREVPALVVLSPAVQKNLFWKGIIYVRSSRFLNKVVHQNAIKGKISRILNRVSVQPVDY